MKTKILGMMSGSSLDGLDLAICEFEAENYIFHATEHVPFPDSIKSRLMDPLALTSSEFLILSSDVGLFFAQSAQKFIKSSGVPVDLIVSHGHTVFHQPGSNISCQIGNGGIISSITGIDVLCDLRIQDVACGGQGAPLASLIDLNLFKDFNIKLNLGGIANVSFTVDNQVRSWDVSPCNQVLNHLASLKGLEYDDKGHVARGGNFNDRLFKEWRSMPYFSLNPPKSMDNYWVKNKFMPAIHDLPVDDALNTMCRFMAYVLARDLDKYLPQGDHKMMITGGGAHNRFLIECISDKGNIEIMLPDEEVIDFKEALLMAYMGYRYLNGLVNVISSATGNKKDIVAGALYKGNGVQ